MIDNKEIQEILAKYDSDRLTIGTLGSHSALNILKGAQEEGFKTVCVCRKADAILYRRFGVADELVLVRDFADVSSESIQEKLRHLNTILVPHGSFTAYLSMKQMADLLRVPMFGNRELLNWETSREKQREWLSKAELRLPRTFKKPEEIRSLTIAKLPGAKGGKGYFLSDSPESFHRKVKEMVGRKLLNQVDIGRIHLQEYILGVNVYPHYFSSIVNDDVEFFGVDRRYESAVDAIGKIPASEQLRAITNPTYTIVGNIPITLRESLLPELIRMGDSVVNASKDIVSAGIIGPFCLEMVITDNLEIYVFEISARIVAGTNVGIGTSPYAYLKHGNRMYMGRRIAVEIREARKRKQLPKIIT